MRLLQHTPSSWVWIAKLEVKLVKIDMVKQSNKVWDNVFQNVEPNALEIETELAKSIETTLKDFLPNGGSLLEAGSGTGQLSAQLSKSGFSVSLLDKSQVALELSRKVFEHNNCSGEFVEGDLFKLPFEENSFDCVWNSGVLEHFTDEVIIQALKEMGRVSKDLVVSLVPNANAIFYRVGKWYLEKTDAWPYGVEEPRFSLVPQFEEAGLGVITEFTTGVGMGLDWIYNLPNVSKEVFLAIREWYESEGELLDQLGYLVVTVGSKKPHLFKPQFDEAARSKLLPMALKETNEQVKALRNFLNMANINIHSLTAVLNKQMDEKNLLVEEKQKLTGILKEKNEAQKAIEAELEEKVNQLAKKDTSITDYEARLNQLHADLCDRDLLISRMYATKGWRILEKFRRVRNGIKHFANKASIQPNQEEVLPEHSINGGLGDELREILEKNQEVKGIIVYPPTLDWFWMKQRPQHVLENLAREGYLVFYCAKNEHAHSTKDFQRIEERLYLCDSIVPLFAITNPILWIGYLENYHYISQFQNPFVIYDYLDDISIVGKELLEDRRTLYNQILERADVVFATADVLLEQVKVKREDVIYCPNAVSLKDFSLDRATDIPKDMQDIVAEGKPIIGYYGALAQWFDFDLVEYLATSLLNFEFILIGPDEAAPEKKSRVYKLGNVHYLGLKTYEELPAYLKCFDVATIPFVCNELTMATSPVKLFEYMAAGKPVVTTKLNECEKYAEVLISEDYQSFAKNLMKALELKDDQEFVKSLLECAKNNTWAERARLISETIKYSYKSPLIRSKTEIIDCSGKVAILTNNFFNYDGENMYCGGAERYLIDLCRLIKEEFGKDTIIFQSSNNCWETSYFEIPVIGLPSKGDVPYLNHLFHNGVKNQLLTIYNFCDLTFPLTNKESVVISHGIYWDTPFSQQGEQQKNETKGRIFHALKRCKKMVSVDTNTINWIRAESYYLAEKAVYVPNYVDVEEFLPTERDGTEITILYPRRLYAPRGFNLMLEVTEHLIPKYNNVNFYYVGKADPAEAELMNNLVAKYPSRVRWESFNPEDMYKAYEQSDVVVVPTINSEGTSLSCLEAMACGKIVISTDVGGLPNLVINNYNGLLIKPSYQELLFSIEYAINNFEHCKRLGIKAREVAKEAFNKGLWKEQWVRVLRELLKL